MKDTVEVIKTKGESLMCNICKCHKSVCDIRFKTCSPTAVLRLCNDCLNNLKNKLDLLKK